MRDSSTTHLIIIVLLFIVTINLLLLNIKVFAPNTFVSLSDVSTKATPEAKVTSSSTSATTFCPNGCIKESSEEANLKIGAPEIVTPTLKSTQTGQKEFYIPLGTGNTQKSSWDDLVATETIIDPSNYGIIKEAYFIASLRNPTLNGQTEARLYNVTDNNMVWGSHVVMNGPSEQTITSQKFTLPTGNKLYRVQLKSSINFLVYLDNAKIRLITQ